MPKPPGVESRPQHVYTLDSMGKDKPQTQFTSDRKAAYVAAYGRSGEVSAAAAAVGVTRQTVYNHLRTDPDFAKAVERADGELHERLMATCKRLAIEGVPHRTYDKDGNVISEKLVYSERVLLTWLKRRDRQHWGDKVDVNQKVDATVQHKGRIEVEKLTPQQRRAARDFLATLPRTEEPSEN